MKIENPLTMFGLLPRTDELGKIIVCNVTKNRFNKIKYHCGLMDKDWFKYKDVMILIITLKPNNDAKIIENETQKPI